MKTRRNHRTDFRLDDSRSAQQHRDLLELEYDRAELEDWSFSLSTEDLVQNESAMWKEQPATTNTPALPAIKEHNLLELEEDANECLWNGASYLADRTGGELVRTTSAISIDVNNISLAILIKYVVKSPVYRNLINSNACSISKLF